MHKDSIAAGLSRHIRKSTKPLTILLTDVGGSTEYFDERGDIEGRLMVDQHNRLVFPVITRFRGKIIKTTGSRRSQHRSSGRAECPQWVYSVEKLETLNMPYFC